MSKKIERPTKEDIINYYINTTITQEEAAKHYGMSAVVFRRVLKEYGLRKSQEQKYITHLKHVKERKIKKPTKEELIEIYLIQNKTKKECCAIVGCSETQFSRYLKEYNISKNSEQRGEIIKKIAAEKKPDVPSAEEIIERYINTTKTRAEVAKEFGVSNARFGQWLDVLGLHKTAEQVQDTITHQNLQKYGVVNATQLEEVKAKTRKTCLKKYGVDNPSKAQEIINKIIDSESIKLPKDELYNKYIIEQLSQAQCAQYFGCGEEVVRNNLNRYGILKTQEEVQTGRKQTCLQKYGTTTALLNKTVQQKIHEKILDKYGVENAAQANINHVKIWNSKDKIITWAQEQEVKPTSVTMAKFFNVHQSTAIRKVHECGLEEYVQLKPMRSQYEDEIVTELKSWGITKIEVNVRGILDNNQEIDIYLPDYKFGIEFNGDYFHSDLQKKFQDHGGRSTRHQEKSLSAEKNGIFLFHIFEHEWDEQFLRKNNNLDSKQNILNRIKTILGLNKISIGARKCDIKEVSKEVRDQFLNINHMQGTEKHSSYILGLYYQGELVSCMTFGRSKFKQYDWDLMRFCTKHGINIPGGASRLFHYFVNNKMQSGEKLVSYSDITKTKGSLYQTLGFKQISVNAPNYWWVNLDTYDVRSRYKEQAAGEVERMHNAGYCRVCDCGTKTWLYTKK